MTRTAPVPEDPCRPPDAVLTISLDRIQPSRTNPRKHFNDAAQAELEESVRQHGILQPLLVRPIQVGEKEEPEAYEIVAGERRYRAAQAAQLVSVPVLVRQLKDEEVLELQLVENLRRSDLHPMEEARGYKALLHGHPLWTVGRIAERVGRSAAYIYDRFRLLDLVTEAERLFTDGRITASHAVLLSRLHPRQQMGLLYNSPGEGGRDPGPIFQSERLLWSPKEAAGDEQEDPLAGLKVISVAELKAYIDEHIRFDPEAEDLPELFPETHEALSKAQEEAEKVISITYGSQVHPYARDGSRVFTPRSWKRADGRPGNPTCEHAVTGVIVAGPDRGKAFRVCIAKKKCAAHWGAEQREAKKHAREALRQEAGGRTPWEIAEEKRKLARAREDAERERWKAAMPKLLAELAAKVRVAKAGSKGLLGTFLRAGVDWRCDDDAALVPPGATAEDLVRHLAFAALVGEMREWAAHRVFPKRLKAFGLDAAKIVAAAVPTPKPPEAGSVPTGKKRKVTTIPEDPSWPRDVRADKRQCASCGCTTLRACPGGCNWVKDDLCSACHQQGKKKRKA